MPQIKVDPVALGATAGQMAGVGAEIHSVQATLRSDLNAAAAACGDGGLASALSGFSSRLTGTVMSLGDAVSQTSSVLTQVEELYVETDQNSMPPAP